MIASLVLALVALPRAASASPEPVRASGREVAQARASAQARAEVGVARLAILPVRARAFGPDLGPALTAVLGVEAARHGTFEVVVPGDIDSLLDLARWRDALDAGACELGPQPGPDGSTGPEPAGPGPERCATAASDVAGVDYLVGAHVGRLGHGHVLDLVLLDVHSGRPVARTYDLVEGRDEALVGAARRAVRSLLAAHQRAAQVVTATLDPPASAVGSPGAAPLPAGPGPHPGAGPSGPDPVLAGWLTAGAGAVGLVAGGVLHHVGSGAGVPQRRDLPVQVSGDILLGLGAAATLGGLFAVAWGSVQVTPSVSPAGAAVSLRLAL